MNKTKIEWSDSTWNPVTGCRHGCEYCYARKIAERFKGFDTLTIPAGSDKNFSIGGLNDLGVPADKISKDGKKVIAPYPFGFQPTLHRYRLGEYEKKAGRTIFVCSMADLFGAWVPDSWIEEIFAACERAPQHRYLFLTKNPERYADYGVPIADNMWYGTTVTKRYDVHKFNYLPAFSNIFVSIEPLLEDITPEECNIMFRQADWFIIGAETGRSKNKVIPQTDWINRIIAGADAEGKPVFMKDSLKPIVGKENMRREFPWDRKAKKAAGDGDPQS